MLNKLTRKEAFKLECGGSLNGIIIGYHHYRPTSGSAAGIVWVCHALTADSDPVSWWPGVVGPGCVIDTERYEVICANILGSCYGTTGPADIDSSTGKPYGRHFPKITIRDQVCAHIALRKHLGVDKIDLLIGGSMGGFQAQEWAVMEPDVVRKMCLLATLPNESPWGKAIHTTQRLAIESDPTWYDEGTESGRQGLKVARGIGMLSYRNPPYYNHYQADANHDIQDIYRASSYILYQGEKLAKRFNAWSYHTLTMSMDSHHLARGRAESVEAVLAQMHMPVLVLAISSDFLCPLEEMSVYERCLPNAEYIIIDSEFGHDGFLVEADAISTHLHRFMETHR